MEFKNTGFINFNPEYNKKLKTGSVTCSISFSQKNKKGAYETFYMNALLPENLLIPEVKDALNGTSKSQLFEMKGFISGNKYEKKTYYTAVLYDVKPTDKKNNEPTEHKNNKIFEPQEVDNSDLPF